MKPVAMHIVVAGAGAMLWAGFVFGFGTAAGLSAARLIRDVAYVTAAAAFGPAPKGDFRRSRERGA